MRMKKMKWIVTFLLLIFTSFAFSQGSITGKVVIDEVQNPLPGATVMLVNTSLGVTTDLNGTFVLNIPNNGEVKIKLTYVGFEDQIIDVVVNKDDATNLGEILMVSNDVGLSEVEVFASMAIDRKTPVAVSTISEKTIETELGQQELPEIMKFTPSVFATKSGGGFGDARVNIRGFNQRNVAVLINGIPVNDMESGWVYWSNWAGLGDATRAIQVQRGLGASKLAINSVGGTMNIITKTSDMKKGGSVMYNVTDYGNQKMMVSLSSGMNKKGFAVTFVGSRTEGPGYIDQTYVDAWSYFLSMTKVFNKNHTLVFTAIGAPQTHGQRRDRLTQEQHDYYGSKYNPNWGSRYSENQSQRENYYHKPQFALNWYWNINPRTNLATSYYVSIGDGGGSGPLSTYSNNADGDREKNYDPYDEDGQLDYTYMVNENATHQDQLYADTNIVGGFSKYILRNSVNKHFWTGLLSTLNHEFSDNLKLTAGVDGRYYKGEHYREVRDLLGGEYYYEQYKYAKDGVNGRDQFKQVGDRIAYDNDGIVTYGGAFSQLEYTTGGLSVFAAATVSNTWYQRIDRYNYVEANQKSEVVTKIGYNGKIGANYNINEAHNVFVNAGYYSRAPFFSQVFVNYANDVATDLENEKVAALEIGYGMNYRYFNAKVNAYYTSWKDKSLLSRSFQDPVSGNDTRAFISGLDAIHKGIEFEGTAQILPTLKLGLVASLGDWQWANNVDAVIIDDETQDTLANINVYAEGLYVSDAPQTQLGLRLMWNMAKGFNTSAQYVYYDRLYAEFDPADRDDPSEIGVQPYKLPAYGLLDWNIGYSFPLSKTVGGYFGMNVNNVFDVDYMSEALDGSSHTQADASGWWGYGRTFNWTFRVNF
jgi:hypothetical protein